MKQPGILRANILKRSIKTRLMVWFLLFSLLPLGIVGYFSYSTASKAIQDNVEEKLSRISMNNIDKIDRILHERFNDVQVWSALELAKLTVQIGSGIGGASEFVNYLIQQYRVYSVIMLLDRDGICVTANTVNNKNEALPTEKVLLGQNFSQEPWFINAIQGNGAVVTDWHQVRILERVGTENRRPVGSNYSMIFISAIRDFDGTILGVWANVINWEVFQEILQQIQTELPDVTTSVSSLLLLSDNDTIIACSGLHAENDLLLYGKSLATDLQQPELATLLSQQKGVFSYMWDRKPKTAVLAREKGFERYPGKNWGYLMLADNISTYAPIRALRSQTIWVGLLTTLAILGLIYIIGNRVATPLVLLSDTAVAIANGDLTKQVVIPEPGKKMLASRDEVEMLLHSFQQMAENLQRLIMQMKDAIQQVNQASEQISAALRHLSDVSTQQSSAIIETTGTVEEFVNTSREIARSADHVTIFAETTEQEAHKGVNAAVETLARIQAIKQANDQNMQHVMALNERSKEIDAIVEFITAIADTTDLIAFNAALEAAGAGEKGKRFGVVASEIRRLANTVATSIKNIKSKTSEIQNGIHVLVDTFDMETQRIEEGGVDMQVTAASLESILAKIERTTSSLKQISAATKQQQTSNEHIATILQNMARETGEFQTITHQALNITTELSALAETLQHTVNVFQIAD